MELIAKIAECIEHGKIDKNSPYPPQLLGQPGADEWTKSALENGIEPSDILNLGMISAMKIVGQKFSRHEIYIPQMLMSAKAMSKAMGHLKPYFNDNSIQRKGTFVLGTVFGDLHDIGKNLVTMMVEGTGWEVIDLGVDVRPEKFIEAINENPRCVVGLSALLTTTMVNMEKVVQEVKAVHPDTPIIIGGAPLNTEFSKKIGASAYAPGPQGAVEFLESLEI